MSEPTSDTAPEINTELSPEKRIAQNACRFVHLRLHSSYSLLEGAIRAKELPKLCEKNAMPAVAVTDTGNLFGALEFSESLSGAGIQPVTGVTLAVDMDEGPADPIAQQRSTKWEPSGRIALLVKDETGYGNLMKLSTKAFLETDQTLEPHVTVADLEQYAEGLICLTGGPAGPVNRLLAQSQLEAGEAMLIRLQGIYSDRLYVELQRHGLEEEVRAEGPLVDMAYKQGLPLVATNEAYFKTRDEFEAHDALICIAEGSYVSETDRRRLTPEHYFKSQDEMAALFADLPEALENTIEIARRCAYRPLTRNPILPRFDTGEGLSEADELRRQAEEGLKKRLTEIEAVAPEEEYWERLRFELDVIINMDFPGYFLIVSDFIKWAKEHDIPVGPGRGSGAGSLVAYALLITDLDPLRFGLLFERFLNPERVSMPDFDIDFCQDRRDEVIRYVQDKYGYDQVAQIITFGKLQARAVLRDVGRVLQMPYGQVDRLCKLVPNNPANPVTLEEAIDGEPKLREERDREEVVARLLEIGLILEGLYRHASTHAAGVVIGDRKLDELVPLYRDPRSDMPVTQFNMKWVEPAGLVKFDFLGLKTLTVLKTAVDFIQAEHGVKIDIGQIPLEDEKTYSLLTRAETIGIFQLESSGMRDLVRQARPTNIEDIIALVALYRPGPMDNIPKYLACKHGREKPEFLHEAIEPVVEDTYGVIIYQEQVMQIAQVFAGYSLGEADLLRRAMGKKIKAEMDAQRSRFVEGAMERGVDKTRAEYVFDLVDKFAGYGFNKSHSAAYAYVAYQTAWLKANYPVEFLAASMNLDMNNTDKLNVFKQDAVRLGIEVCSPNVNESEAGFSVKDGKILYALGAIKNVGHQAMEELVAIRREGGPFKDVYDFARRMNPRGINKRMLENLIRAGALDCLNPHRAQLFKSVDTLMALASQAAEERASNQNSLFGDAADSMDSPALAKAEPWMPIEKLNEEFGALGFFLSGHPLDDYQVAMNRAGVVTYQQLVTRGNRAEKVAGIVAARRDRRSQRGNAYSFVTLSDATGQFDMVVFSEALNQAGDLLDPGQAVVVNVEIDREGDDVRLRAQSVRAIDTVAADTAAGLKIFLDSAEPLTAVKSRLGERGRGAVSLVLMADGQEVEMALKDRFHVTPAIRGAIRSIPGVVEVQDI